jgi:hypothetical protein
MVAMAAAIGPAVQARAAEEGKPAAGSATFHYEAKGRRDPFVSLIRDGRYVTDLGGGESQSSGQFTLRGILWDPSGASIAMIDDVEVKVGDTIQGYRVTDIQQDAVILIASGGERVVLELAFNAPSSGPSAHTATGGGEP